MALNGLGGELRVQPAPVTLPALSLPDIDDQEIIEAAARVAERKVIRAGLDAWHAIGKADNFEGWKTIGAALAIGKTHALRVTGANQAWGSAYSRTFGEWMREHHFDTMPKSVRSVAIELHENAGAIDAWRATLSDKDRRRLVHPLSNVRRWRTATEQGERKRDAQAKAAAAWRRFVSLVEALPPEQAAPLWRVACDQATLAIANK